MPFPESRSEKPAGAIGRCLSAPAALRGLPIPTGIGCATRVTPEACLRHALPQACLRHDASANDPSPAHRRGPSRTGSGIGRRAAFGVAICAATLARSATASEDREEWQDRARGRTLPVLLRRPATPGPHPAVVLSHGLGGSREGLGYLGRALAEAGFVALHIQHPGSDTAIWQGRPDPFRGMQEAARDPRNAANRLLDLVFALDALPRRVPVDMGRLAAAGHSFGAWTVQHAMGQALPLAIPGIPERRLRAGILLSPVPPLFGAPEVSAIRAPLLHVTGTEDRTMVGAPAGPEERLALWRAIGGVKQAAAVFQGATHLAFAGGEELGAGGADTGFHARTAALCVLFLRATLLADAEAAQEIARGAPGVLAAADTLTVKDWA